MAAILSKPRRQAHRAVAVGAALAVEFAGAEHMGEGQPDVVENDRCAGLEIGDQRFLVDAVTAGKGIAVEEDITRHNPPFGAGEQVPGEVGVAGNGGKT